MPHFLTRVALVALTCIGCSGQAAFAQAQSVGSTVNVGKFSITMSRDPGSADLQCKATFNGPNRLEFVLNITGSGHSYMYLMLPKPTVLIGNMIRAEFEGAEPMSGWERDGGSHFEIQPYTKTQLGKLGDNLKLTLGGTGTTFDPGTTYQWSNPGVPMTTLFAKLNACMGLAPDFGYQKGS